MKKILFIALCCLCLGGCNSSSENYSTFCYTETEEFLQTGNRLSTTIKHDKINFISYTDNNFYIFDTITEAIEAENYLNNECDNYKNNFVNCSIERDDKIVSITIDVECHDGLDCSYSRLVSKLEDKDMLCEETIEE